MPATPAPTSARTGVHRDGGWLEVRVEGDWRITQRRPSWEETVGTEAVERVRVTTAGLGYWDTSLLLFLFEGQKETRRRGGELDLSRLPEKIRALLEQFGASDRRAGATDRSEKFLVTVGLSTGQAWANVRLISHFIGECVLAFRRILRAPGKIRLKDYLDQMQQCGAMALPIVNLIAFLIGLTFAYQSAVTLREFGADIYIADVVGVLMVREMGPMMVAIVLSGRTGAAFAATLGNMKTNDEIDALEVLGISSVDFLVLPRLVALAIMLPLLVLYANCVGILGGMVVAKLILQIPPTAYWIETRGAIDLTDLTSGLVKAAVFGVLIGLSGCLRGLQSERSAAGVGHAATSAVVTSIVLIILADAFFAVLYHMMGI